MLELSVKIVDLKNKRKQTNSFGNATNVHFFLKKMDLTLPCPYCGEDIVTVAETESAKIIMPPLKGLSAVIKLEELRQKASTIQAQTIELIINKINNNPNITLGNAYAELIDEVKQPLLSSLQKTLRNIEKHSLFKLPSSHVGYILNKLHENLSLDPNKLFDLPRMLITLSNQEPNKKTKRCIDKLVQKALSMPRPANNPQTLFLKFATILDFIEEVLANKHATVDHIKPKITQENIHNKGNLVISCQACNREKKYKPTDEWFTPERKYFFAEHITTLEAIQLCPAITQGKQGSLKTYIPQLKLTAKSLGINTKKNYSYS
jgi:hypothetical protein